MNERQHSLILKSVQRLKHYNSRDYLKPKTFDRWRQFVQMRKLVRYHLGKIQNTLAPGKSPDLQQAFQRWKSHFENRYNELKSRTRAELVAKSTMLQERLDRCDEAGAEKTETIQALSMDKDVLCDDYQRGRNLAAMLGRDHHYSAMHKSYSWLNRHMFYKQREEYETLLQRNIEVIAQLKDRVA